MSVVFVVTRVNKGHGPLLTTGGESNPVLAIRTIRLFDYRSSDALGCVAKRRGGLAVINKQVPDWEHALEGLGDGAVVMIGGFGPPGQPEELIEGLLDKGVRDLTVVNNNAGAGGDAIGRLFAERRVRKVICSFPKAPGSTVFEDLYRAGEIELELVPQGTLAERIRAAGAGIAAFYTRTAVGTELAAGKPIEVFDGQEYVMERALHADFALVRAHCADPWGNLTYRKTARNFGPVMLAAARVAVVEVDRIVPLGALDPEVVVTPSLYVDRLLCLSSVGDRTVEGQKALGESA